MKFGDGLALQVAERLFNSLGWSRCGMKCGATGRRVSEASALFGEMRRFRRTRGPLPAGVLPGLVKPTAILHVLFDFANETSGVEI